MSTTGTVFEQSFDLPAPPERAWAALTDARSLEAWFCEHAEVEPSVGGAWRFWGRHTPFDAGEADADQTITGFDPPRRLGFTWTWGRGRCEVDLTLAPAPGGATLRVTHRMEGAPAASAECDPGLYAQDFWIVAAANLAAYLRAGAPAVRPDYTEPGPDVEVEIAIDAPAESVWRELTDPARMAGWLGCDRLAAQPRVDLRAGGVYTFGWAGPDGSAMGPTEILELDPPRRLVVSWRHGSDATDRTEWTITPVDATSCRLAVRQVGTRSADEGQGYRSGWAAFLLLIRRAAMGAPGPA
ncbi:MAG: SRPBCC domain-containing protein [Phycisphaerales bacterium]